VKYETFLFTRSKARDFTAFIRPVGMTHKEVSVIANAFNYVNDITPLTPDFPALYLFPLGDHLFLLRHYDSGRTHAGREIPVIEGIAAKRDIAKSVYAVLPHFVTRQSELLNVVAQYDDIETLEFIPSPQYEWDEWDDTIESVEIPKVQTDESLLVEFISRHREDRLCIPFSETGRSLLLAAVTDLRFPYLNFGFGTNADVVSSLSTADIPLDVLSYVTTTEPSFLPRDRNRRVTAREAQVEVERMLQQHNVQPVPASAPTPPPAAPVPPSPPVPPPRQRKGLIRQLVDLLLGRR